MANLTVPATGATILKDTIESGDVFPVGGVFFGASGALARVTASVGLPVKLAADQGAVAVSGTVTVGAVPKIATTTRVPVWASGLHLTVGASSSRAGPLTGTEVMVSPSTDCYIVVGDNTAAATAGAGSLFLAAGTGPHYFQITSGQYVAAIRASADGVASVVPVA